MNWETGHFQIPNPTTICDWTRTLKPISEEENPDSERREEKKRREKGEDSSGSVVMMVVERCESSQVYIRLSPTHSFFLSESPPLKVHKSKALDHCRV